MRQRHRFRGPSLRRRYRQPSSRTHSAPRRVTVGSLAFGIVANADKFVAGVTATKAELRDLKSAFIASQSPAEQLSTKIAHLENLAAKFPEKAGPLHKTISKMRAEMDKAQGSASTFSSVLGKVGLNIDPLQAAFTAGRMALQGFHTLVNKVSESMAAIEKTSFAADKLGISEESLVGLRGAAEDLAGVTAETFDSALSKFATGIGQAAMKGTGPAADALSRLGLDAGAVSGMSVDEQILAVADALQKVENVNERLALGKALGKGVEELVPMLVAGGDEIRRLADEQNRLSQTSFLDHEGMREALAAVRDLEDAFGGMLGVIGSEFAPLIESMAKKLTDMFTGSGAEDFRGTIAGVAAVTREVVNEIQKIVEFANSPAGRALISAADNAFLSGAGGFIAGGISEAGDARVREIELDKKLKEAKERLRAKGMLPDEVGGPGQAGIRANEDKKAGDKIGRDLQKQMDEVDRAMKEELDFRVMEQKAMLDIASAVEQAKEREMKARERIADDLQRQMDQVNKEIADKGQQLAESLKTPAEKIGDQFAQLQESHRLGAIDDATFAKALDALKARAESVAGTESGPSSVRAIRAGSIEALRQQQYGGRDNTEKQLREQQTANGFLKNIEAAINNLKTQQLGDASNI